MNFPRELSKVHGWPAVGEPTMLSNMSEQDWTAVLRVFRAARSRRGDKGRDDRKFLEALHHIVVHGITWRALPAQFGSWNTVWKRFWRLSQAGTFEAFVGALAAMGETAHLAPLFGSIWYTLTSRRPGQKGAKPDVALPQSWWLFAEAPSEGHS